MTSFVDFTTNDTIYHDAHIKGIENPDGSNTFLMFAYCDIGYREKECIAMGSDEYELMIWADLHNIMMRYPAKVAWPYKNLS